VIARKASGRMNARTKNIIRYSVLTVLILALAAMLIPNLPPARFVFHERLTFKIQVRDRATGSPVTNADVWILFEGVDLTNASPSWGASTEDRGTCDVAHGFEAKGVLGRSGQFDLTGRRLVVRAEGYRVWDRPLDSLFGETHEYYRAPRVLPYEVALEKTHGK